MTDIARMVEQHILEHESRLKHVDELLAHARKGAGNLPEYAQIRTKLDELAEKRDRHAVQLDDLKAKAAEEWQQHEIEQSGLMGVWDALAQDLERLVERLGK
ncbi:MAG: hypothetical protein U9Q81_24265 [Pseudomonadota bacterium]|nr:hypothetical protein [Pseudomonadota bacterium]